MLLACDLGNTFAKFGIYDEDILVAGIKSSYDNFTPALFSKYTINCAAVSSVVPAHTMKLSVALSYKYGITPFIIHSKSHFNLRINYLTPNALGTDRICSAEGAFALYKKSKDFKKYNDKTCIVTIDMGTATTINIIGFEAEFSGGIILPGLSTMAKALNTNTAGLPEINPGSDYTGFIGHDTKSSIASGIINSTAGLIENTIRHLKNELKARQIKIYITGGNAPLMLKYLETEHTYVEDLVLRGVKTIYERNMVG
ncbi:MAG: type III pantothenate kinase [Ignavibacteria bacterium]